MPVQQVIVNGHTYTLEPLETATYCDYAVTYGTPTVYAGLLMWDGNGSTTFNYKVTDNIGEYVGIYPDINSAVAGLDAKLWP